VPADPRIDPLATAFAGVAELYDRARLPTEPEPIEWALDAVGAGPTSTVLDLAAGTGKLSVVLAPRVGRLIAVEPLAEMRAVLHGHLPDVEALDGTAEAIPLPDAAVDAVFVGSAFHWFDGPAALREIHRVLRPDGGLAIVYPHARWRHEPWSEELSARLDASPHTGIRPATTPASGRWRRAFDDTRLFGPLESATFPSAPEMTVAQFQLLVASWSRVAALPDEERAALLGDIGDLLARHGVERFALQAENEVYVARRLR
jgi:ubiquinone/menaquinone biosynthesis C-methylase UbiE